jgi:hypothetical protein
MHGGFYSNRSKPEFLPFSTSPTLFDGQTVLQHGFYAVGLKVYLEAYPLFAGEPDHLTIMSKPAPLSYRCLPW